MTKRYRDDLEEVETEQVVDGERPTAFTWRGHRYQVTSVLGHWREDPGWWRRPSGEPIRIGFANEVPWAYPGEDNKPLGFVNAYVLGVLHEMGYDNITPVVTDWGGLIPGPSCTHWAGTALGCPVRVGGVGRHILPTTLVVRAAWFTDTLPFRVLRWRRARRPPDG